MSSTQTTSLPVCDFRREFKYFAPELYTAIHDAYLATVQYCTVILLLVDNSSGDCGRVPLLILWGVLNLSDSLQFGNADPMALFVDRKNSSPHGR
jgi:hypothetical protein